MKESRSVEREVKGEIMRTDVFVKLISTTKSESDLNRDVSDAFVSFRDVARRFSRFREGSELSALNAASEIRVSPEMTALVVEALAFYESTGRVFDPSIISDLEREGYASSYGEPSFGVPLLMAEKEPFRFGDLTVDLETSIIRKPKTLRI
ncbi:MAG: FAD:protein FMN transferase, partial [Candidatus Moranbacteria bacterium]|nr:FAD:protein FMN transferase [Candidatus Moranbacteria bacterium]